MTRSVETVIVGAGQAGLVTSRLLSDAGREHVVLERRSTLGGAWQDRWDAFQLVSPNWTVGVPGLDYQGDEPDGFMARNELIAHWRRYADVIDAPVELDTDVTELTAAATGAARFLLTTSRGAIVARDVIVAGGPFQAPFLPPVAQTFPRSVHQVHSHHYRRPDELPPGRVLLIGTGQSGVQLAEELMAAGREVILSVGRCGHVPRVYRGHDFFWWLRRLATDGPALGVTLPQVGDLPSPAARFACNPQLSGHGGGHAVTLRALGADGARLVGRFEGVNGTTARFAPDLNEKVRFADGFFDERFRVRFETYAARSREDLPPADPGLDPGAPENDEHADLPETRSLDLRAEGVSTVLWTSGYRPAFGWIDAPILDDFGLPRQVGGRTNVPGLSFLGTPWLVDMGSANLVGLVRDAEALVAT
jgi:putative flavoprotein involved in K+ transport